jgi:GrpB-like predicted nucleotidyltransferase (UPF0157 family)
VKQSFVGVVGGLIVAWSLAWCAWSVASPAPSGAARAVIDDCTAHGRLVHRHSATALRQALAALPQEVREYSDCERVIRRALKRPGAGVGRRAGADRVGAVFRDCADEVLDRRFPQRTLRRALRHMPADLREYSRCEQVVRRELRQGR